MVELKDLYTPRGVPSGSSVSDLRHSGLTTKVDPGAYKFSGSGFPEGVVTAPVGSVYEDTAGTNGAYFWIKKIGSGNTGWRILHGDTGWVTQTAYLNGCSAIGTGTRIRRVNNLLLIHAEIVLPGTYVGGQDCITLAPWADYLAFHQLRGYSSITWYLQKPAGITLRFSASGPIAAARTGMSQYFLSSAQEDTWPSVL